MMLCVCLLVLFWTMPFVGPAAGFRVPGLVALYVTTLVVLSAAYALGVRMVTSPSVPEGLYLTRELEEHDPAPIRDQYVCLDATGPFAPPALREGVRAGILPSDWEHSPLMKKVAAVPGDLVTYEERPEPHVAINGVALPASAHRGVGSLGQPLPMPRFPFRLRPGELWLTSEHPLGFDSRYFGPVQVRAIRCTGEALWTW